MTFLFQSYFFWLNLSYIQESKLYSIPIQVFISVSPLQKQGQEGSTPTEQEDAAEKQGPVGGSGV
jgi:hypothetical protein